MAKTPRHLIRPDELKTISRVDNSHVKLPAGSYVTVGSIQYANTTDLVLSTNNVGPGGLDIGPFAASNKLYYVYAIFSSGLKIIASLNGIAPAGYTAYKFIGYFDTDNNTDIVVASNFSNGSVGDVKTSNLTETEFRAENGPGWILADTRTISGSRYASYRGVSSSPDYRGLVLRGKNNGRSDGNQNPDGELALGQFQNHEMNSHNPGGGNHVHNVQVVNYQNNPNGQIGPQGHSPYYPDHPGTPTGQSGNIIASNGGNETRMRNGTTNIFLKIN